MAQTVDPSKEHGISRFHVFIATTQGLIKIQHLSLLLVEAPSTVVLSNSSKKSKLANDYHDFVQANSGIINRLFSKGASADRQYRLTLSAEIDHGESWHLAVFIAHLLLAHSRLAEGDVMPGDEIILASGEIDISTLNVRQVSHLAQKCFRASHQISQLFQHSHLSGFFVPGENYRQPLPDIDMVLTPIDHINQLISFFSRIGIGENSELSHQEDTLAVASNPKGIEILAVQDNRHIPLKSLMAAIAIIVLIGWYQLLPDKTAMIEKRVGLNACIDPDETVHVFDVEHIIDLPPTFMHGLCSLAFSMPEKYKSAFVVSTDDVFLQLGKTKDDTWLLPATRDKSQTRTYLIVFFTSFLDEADIQSLRAITKQSDDLTDINAMLSRWSPPSELLILRHQLK
ncbi:MAG: hypothetical protein AAGJ37_08415 [Pseudomonadota bacterium]